MINIRLADLHDAEKIYEMCLLFNDSETKTSLQGVKDYLQNNEVIVCIAQIEDETVGFICGRIEYNLSFGSPIGDITEVFVKAQHRQKGIATKLFKHMEQAFLHAGINRFRVFTTEDNKNAVNFYNSQNYQQYNTVMFRKDV